MKSSLAFTLFNFLFMISVSLIIVSAVKTGHVINLRSPALYPESFIWNPKHYNFIVGSTRHQKLITISLSGVMRNFINDTDLPINSSFLGLSVDLPRNRILACIHRIPNADHPSPFNALAGYDFKSRRRIFLTPLLDRDDQNPIVSITEIIHPAAANDVTVDSSGNAYVTNSDGDFIWKVNVDGEASIFSRSKVFKSHSKCGGLNGIVYISEGYVLVVQAHTGRMYKVDVNNGTAKVVNLDHDLTAGDGMAVRSDGVILVASQQKLYYIKSEDDWESGVVFDDIALDVDGYSTAVAVGNRDRVFVLYGYVMEGIMGNGNREEFNIVEIEEEHDREDKIWLFILVVLGLGYFLIWRYQMRKLVQSINKRTT